MGAKNTTISQSTATNANTTTSAQQSTEGGTAYNVGASGRNNTVNMLDGGAIEDAFDFALAQTVESMRQNAAFQGSILAFAGDAVRNSDSRAMQAIDAAAKNAQGDAGRVIDLGKTLIIALVVGAVIIVAVNE